MRFNLNDPNPGIWFEMVKGKPEEGRVCLRPLSDAKTRELDEKTVEKKPSKRNQIIPDIEIKNELRARLRWDYCIVDWEYIQDANGNEIPCTAENKFVLMDESSFFNSIVSGFLETITEEQERLARAELPNL